MASPSAQAQRFRIVSHNQSRGIQQQAGRWVIRPPQQQQPAPNRFLAPAPRNNQPPQQQQFRQGNGNKCFTCGNVDIVTMNWLAENVVGRVPDLEELNDEARERMQLQGIRVDESVQTEK